MGQNSESALANEQYQTINDLQSALDAYQINNNGNYPEKLTDLLGTTRDWSNEKVTNIPQDIVTGKAYIYQRSETGYTLTYEMPEDGTFLFAGEFKEGTNTATEHFISEESARETDEDEDGISAYDEVLIYHTSDYMQDSDGDGYGDKEEIDAGYDPAESSYDTLR